jgi:hypothetical protein
VEFELTEVEVLRWNYSKEVGKWCGFKVIPFFFGWEICEIFVVDYYFYTNRNKSLEIINCP